MKLSTTKFLSVAATRAPSKRVIVWYIGFKRTQSNSLEVFTRMKSLSGFEVLTRTKSLSGFEIFICLWSLYQFLKSLSVFEAFISFWSCNSCLFFKVFICFWSLYQFLKSLSGLRVFIGGGGGALNFFSGRGVRPGFPKCGACELTFASEKGGLWAENFQIWGLVSWKFPNLGACELKFSKFGGLWAKIWVEIEAVEAKIS